MSLTHTISSGGAGFVPINQNPNVTGYNTKVLDQFSCRQRQSSVRESGSDLPPCPSSSKIASRRPITEGLKEPVMESIHAVYCGSVGFAFANRICRTLSEHFKEYRFQVASALDVDDRAVIAEMIQNDLTAGSIFLVVFERSKTATPIDTIGSDLSEDPLRDFIISALKRNIRLVPVLVGHAVMPGINELPEELKQLARIQPICLHSDRWDRDMADLIRRLEQLIATQSKDTLAKPDATASIQSPPRWPKPSQRRLHKMVSAPSRQPPRLPPKRPNLLLYLSGAGLNWIMKQPNPRMSTLGLRRQRHYGLERSLRPVSSLTWNTKKQLWKKCSIG